MILNIRYALRLPQCALEVLTGFVWCLCRNTRTPGGHCSFDYSHGVIAKMVSVHLDLPSLKYLYKYILCFVELDWSWDAEIKTDSTEISNSGRDVTFHSSFSNGTAAVRGNTPLTDDQHYWEIKMMTSVYGTDIVSVDAIVTLPF